MKQLTYKEAYNKIIDAYFKDEIKPMHPNFCFCGTLSPDGRWYSQYTKQEYPYTTEEYRKMEAALFSGKILPLWAQHSEEQFEEALFNGMCVALDELKAIHRGRGENVDEEFETFKKRGLKIGEVVTLSSL